jgi:hypothetical protein
MGLAMIPTTIFSYGYLISQRPIVKAGACTALSGTGILAQKWIFPLVNMVRCACYDYFVSVINLLLKMYDVLAFILCSVRLGRNITAEKGVRGVSRILLQDGLGYFGIVMVGHAFNLYFTRQSSPAKQTAFFTFNVALSSILAQRISKLHVFYSADAEY